jgi:hypothetical protein
LARSIQHINTIYNIQHTTYNLRYTIYDMRHAAYGSFTESLTFHQIHMPHSENDMAPQVNGDQSSSAFLSVCLVPSSYVINITNTAEASHLLPHNLRLNLNLQIESLRRQIHRHHQHSLASPLGPFSPLPDQALPIRISLRCQSGLARRFHALDH